MFSSLNRMVSTAYRNIFIEGVCKIHTTSQLWAEPLKKRRKMDPMVMKMREQRRIRKLEKGIRQLKKHAKKLKPIEEMEVSPRLQKELGLRKREALELPASVISLRQDLKRVWSKVQSAYYMHEAETIKGMLDCQNSALRELKKVDAQLYEAAMRADVGLIPFKIEAVTRTPPLKNYQPPDGKYTETTKKWRP